VARKVDPDHGGVVHQVTGDVVPRRRGLGEAVDEDDPGRPASFDDVVQQHAAADSTGITAA
jgi:hypothetical protein